MVDHAQSTLKTEKYISANWLSRLLGLNRGRINWGRKKSNLNQYLFKSSIR